MLLPIRRPVRPEPLPLNERRAGELVERIALVWLSVRHKRSRAPMALRPKIFLGLRGQLSSPRK